MGDRRIKTCPACPDRSGGAGIPKQPRTGAGALVLIGLTLLVAVALLLPNDSLRAENKAFSVTVAALDTGNNPNGVVEVVGLSIKVTDIPEGFLRGRVYIDIWHQDAETSVMGRAFGLGAYGDGTPENSFEETITFPRAPNAGRWRVEIVIKKGSESLAEERILQINTSRRGVELDEMRKAREKVFNEIKEVRKELEEAYKAHLEGNKTGEVFDEQTWQKGTEDRMQQLAKLRRSMSRDKMVNPFSRADAELVKTVAGLREIDAALKDKLKGGKRVIEEITRDWPPDTLGEFLKGFDIDPDDPNAMQKLGELWDEKVEERRIKAFRDFAMKSDRVSDALGYEIITGKHLADDLAVIRGRVEELFNAYKAGEEKFTPPPDGRKWMQDWMDGVVYFKKRTAERYKPSDRNGINITHPEIVKLLPGLSANMQALRDELLKELYERYEIPPEKREEFPDSPVSNPFARLKTDYAQLKDIVNRERETHIVPLIKVHRDYEALMKEIEDAKGVLPPGHASKTDVILERAQRVFEHELLPYTVPVNVPRGIHGQHNRLYMLSLFSRGTTEKDRRELEALKKRLEAAEKALQAEESNASPSEEKVKQLRKKVYEHKIRVKAIETRFRACEILIATFKAYSKTAVELLEMLLKVEPLPKKPELEDLKTPGTAPARPE